MNRSVYQRYTMAFDPLERDGMKDFSHRIFISFWHGWKVVVLRKNLKSKANRI